MMKFQTFKLITKIYFENQSTNDGVVFPLSIRQSMVSNNPVPMSNQFDALLISDGEFAKPNNRNISSTGSNPTSTTNESNTEQVRIFMDN